MSDQYLGEIRMFAGTYEPMDWMFCDGRSLNITQYSALYAVLGLTYGGNGTTTFNLPDLRGRVPMGMGNGQGLTPRTAGQSFGNETVGLKAAETSHGHSLVVSTNAGTLNNPLANVLGQSASPENLYRTDNPAPAALATASLGNSGQNQAHNNMMPSLGIHFIIAYNGVFPTRG